MRSPKAIERKIGLLCLGTACGGESASLAFMAAGRFRLVESSAQNVRARWLTEGGWNVPPGLLRLEEHAKGNT